MLKVNELLDRTSKTVSSIAAISLSLAVIAVSAVVVKKNIKDLFNLKKVKTHVVCIDSFDVPNTPVAKKESSKKGSSKKGASKSDSDKEVTGDCCVREEAAETK